MGNDQWWFESLKMYTETFEVCAVLFETVDQHGSIAYRKRQKWCMCCHLEDGSTWLPTVCSSCFGLVSADSKGANVWVVCLGLKEGMHTQAVTRLVHQVDGTCNSSLYGADMLKFCFNKRNWFPFSCLPLWTTVSDSPPSVVDSLVGCWWPQYLNLCIGQRHSS